MLQGGRGGFEHREIKIVAGSSRYICVRYMENIQNEQIKPYINNICTNPTPAILLCGHKLYTPDPKEKNTALSTMAYIYQLLPLICPEFEAFERERGVNGGEHITSPLPFL